MTLKEKLLEAFPNATPMDKEGFPLICPKPLGIVDWDEHCPDVRTCYECWELEAENEHNK